MFHKLTNHNYYSKQMMTCFRAYVKMIDVWLIFSQLIPFVEVLLHTLIETMRDADERLINNHGEFRTVQKIKVNTITPEEETDVFITKDRAKILLNIGETAAIKGIPLVILTFSLVYWSYGIYHYMYNIFYIVQRFSFEFIVVG